MIPAYNDQATCTGSEELTSPSVASGGLGVTLWGTRAQPGFRSLWLDREYGEGRPLPSARPAPGSPDHVDIFGHLANSQLNEEYFKE